MAERSLRWRGFAITLEIPERLGQLIRRRRTRPDATAEPLVLRPPPPVSIDSRQKQVSEVREFATAASSALTVEHGHRSAEDIDRHPWYHTIELPDGSVTPGRFDHRPVVPHYGLPESLAGKRVLDIGSGDGFWAFELERRGGDVTSVDVEAFAEVDLPPALRRIFEEHRVKLSFRQGLELARHRLGSQVKLINSSIYDLDPDRIGRFDFVHAGDILLHLRDPVLALQRVHAVTTGDALFADVFDPSLNALAGGGLTRYCGGWTDAVWWLPSLGTLAQMVVDAGFTEVEPVVTYRADDRINRVHGLWRAVLRARA